MLSHRTRLFPLIASLALLTVNDATAEPATDYTEAIWLSQQMPLDYVVRSTYYSCSELKTRVIGILSALGAQTEISRQSPCEDYAPSQRLDLRVTAAMEASSENVRSATTFSSAERLLSELRHQRLPTDTDLARFPARWQKIRLGRGTGVKIRAGDCDLLRLMNAQIFPKIAVRGAPNGFSCGMPGSLIRPQVTVETLVVQ